MDHSSAAAPAFRAAQPGHRWDGVAHMPYKEDMATGEGGAAPFKAISRQVLFAQPELGCEWRYFEMDAGGHSTLERHEHAHAVMILRGAGHAMVGGVVRAVATHDLVSIPPWAWHQFRATGPEPMGFMCMVNTLRDKPVLPSAEELAALRADPAVAAFLDL